MRLTLGRDGKLYFAAESAGGNSLFGRQPRDPAQLLRAEQLVQTDVFTNPTFNTPRNHITWFGRYNPADGSLEQGQFVLARLDDARLRGNSIRPRAIAADEEGRVYLVGATNASIEDRDVRTISGTAVGPYGGGRGLPAGGSAGPAPARGVDDLHRTRRQRGRSDARLGGHRGRRAQRGGRPGGDASPEARC